MKLETIKSFILTILVGVSLLLTLGLWNYQPKYEFLSDMHLYEADIGGKELTKKDVVQPELVAFHDYDHIYSYSNPKKSSSLYDDMQSWVLYNFKVGEAKGKPSDKRQIEMIFPDALPMVIMKDIFTFNGDTYMPDWSFNRIYVTFDSNNTSLKIKFLSVYRDKQATASVNNAKVYNKLWHTLTTRKGLSEYVVYDHAATPVYLPKEPKEMNQQSVTINTINQNKLVRALFPDMSPVKSNTSSTGETYYFDGQRGMRVKQDGHLIRFTNPLNTNYKMMEPGELLDISMGDINEYNGWTGDYSLERLQTSTNYIRYRMNYGGYPVFNSNDLAVMEQEWRNGNLYQYNRPLFSLNSLPNGESKVLPSGDSVINLLEHSNFDLDKITDIRIGYHMIYDSNASYYVTLEPAWYMYYYDDWYQINFDSHKGGS